MKTGFLILSLLPLTLFAQLEVADIFSPGMVLQRDEPVPVWGKGQPGSTVEVSFGTIYRQTKVNRKKEWIVWLPAMKTSAEAGALTIASGDTAVTFTNILTGDVWLCLGQSNMEWPMRREMHFADAVKNSNQPALRFYNPIYAGKNIYNTSFTDSVCSLLTSDNFWQGHWQSCDSNSIGTMSAVAYYFGQSVLNRMKIPVGLINLSIGGAPLETFIDPKAMKKSPAFRAKVQGDWLQNTALPVWMRERGLQNVGSSTTVEADANGKNHAFKPGFAYIAGINKILPLPIKGILLYQGESNAQEKDRVEEYRQLSALMVNDYRTKWDKPDLPFYFVQLSSIDSTNYKSQLWPWFRDEQRLLLQQIIFSGMAVCSDIGAKHDVHPTNKKAVGERLARWALYKTYAVDTVPSGPLPRIAIPEKGKLVIEFLYSDKGISTADGKALKGFSLDGKTDCPAYIENNQVIIPLTFIPRYVYYGWKPFSHGNLINSEGLPASTFKIKVQ